MDELHSECPQGEIEKIQPRKFDDDDIVIPVFSEQEEDANNDEYQAKINDDDLNRVPIVKPLLKFSEGLTAHEEEEHEKAWDCFNLHASIGNSRA